MTYGLVCVFFNCFRATMVVFFKVEDIYIIRDEELQQKDKDEEEKRADRKSKMLIGETNYL